MEPVNVADHLDELEARIRRLMAQHATIQARGFDTAKRRTAIHRHIDSLIDEWAEWSELAALEPA